MENIIEVKGLKKIFSVHIRENDGLLAAFMSMFKRKKKTIVAIDDISFSIKKGDIHALIGPNGAGKSTTTKILSGILFPTDGFVNSMGLIPWENRERYVRNIGVHFGQKSQLTWELPAIDTFAINRMLYKIPENNYKQNLNYLIPILGIEEIVQKPVRNLSLGERMKCEFLCTLLHDPQLVFLDEPTIGIDIISKNAIYEFIKKINKEKGTTFVITTHDLNEIENLCKMVTIINHGKIVFDDSIEKLKIYFSNKKIIDIKFSRQLSPEEKDIFDLYMNDSLSGRIELDADSDNFQFDLSKIISSLPIQDININAIDIETVIKKIYQMKKSE
jgi:ABC-2 type transport system ATP-binding protein